MTSTTVPPTINVRPSGLVALLLAAVSLTAVVTWFLTDLSLDTTDVQSRSAAPAAITATPQDLQAAYAGVYAGRTVAISAERARAAATLAAGVTPGAVISSDERARAAATLAAGVTPGAVAARSWPAVTSEQLRDAWAGLTAASTGLGNGTAVGHLSPGIGGAGAFMAQPLEVAYIGLVAGNTGIGDGTAAGHLSPGIGGAGAFMAQPLEVAYIGLVAGNTGIADGPSPTQPSS